MRHLGHYISFGVNLVMFAFVCVFIVREASRRKNMPSHWLRYGPSYLAVAAALLIMADQTRHVLQDTGVWHSGAWPGSSQYLDDCDQTVVSVPASNCTVNSDCGAVPCGTHGHFAVINGSTCRSCDVGAGACVESAESFGCLSAVGWVFTVLFTYTGFGLFFFASFWNANLVGKLRAIAVKWEAV